MKENYIDFKCSDIWRDHYAAQGLTYDSGRRERRDQQEKHDVGPLLNRIDQQAKTIDALTAEIARIKSMLNAKEKQNEQQFEGPEAV